MTFGRSRSAASVVSFVLVLAAGGVPSVSSACSPPDEPGRSAFRRAPAVLLFEIVGVQAVSEDVWSQLLTIRILRVFKSTRHPLRPGDVVTVRHSGCMGNYTQSDVGRRQLRTFDYVENQLRFGWYSAGWDPNRLPLYLVRSARRYRRSE